MINVRPTPRQERWMAAARRWSVPNGSWITDRIGAWKSPSLLARCAFFALGALVGGLTLAVFELIYDLGAVPVAGVILFAAAEWLIMRKHLFHAGVEEVLWCGGLAALVLHWVPPTGTGMGFAAAIATVFTLAGIRLLNPLFLTVAAIAVSFAIYLVGGHLQLGEPDIAVAASVFCYGVGTIAFLLAGRRFSRPSHDQMLNWLMVIMPLCGFVWLATQHPAAIRLTTGVASALFAAAALVLGIRRRAHAPLIAGLASVGCVVYQLRNLTALSLEYKLILWGSGALLLAWGLDRFLRTPRHGITSRRLSDEAAALELLQMAGAGALSPAAAAHTESPFKGDGGTFSGGGASDSY